MMLTWILQKFSHPPMLPEETRAAYIRTFSSADGQLVLQHLVNGCYATVCYSKDPIEQAAHNGRRSLVHEILENALMKEGYGITGQ